MRRAFFNELALILTTLALSVRPAAAQVPGAITGPVSQEAAEKADELFREGISAMKQQKWTEAEAKLQAAFALNPSYDVATNLGNSQLRLGKYRDAARHLAFGLRSWPLVGKQDQRETARQRLAEAKRHVAAVSVTVSVDGAEVVVDGVSVGRAPLMDDVFVDPGARVFEARLGGHMPAKQMIEAAAGAAASVTLTVVPMAQGSGPSDGATAGGQLKAGGGGSQAGGASVEGGPRKEVLIAGIAASALAIGGGVVFSIVSNAHGNDADEQLVTLRQQGGSKPCSNPALAMGCADIQSSLDARDTFRDLAIWSFVAGGVLGAGTAIYAVVAPRSEAKPESKSKPMSKVRALPVATARGGGVVIAGVW